MPITDICKRDASWFIAATRNDVTALTQKLDKNKGTRDFRTTKVEDNIVKGFTALHYACYMGCVDAVKFLLPHEIGLLTQKEVPIPSPGFSSQAKYKLVGGSTCLTIALLRGAGEVVKYIVKYVEKNPAAQTELIGKLDDEQMCTYLMGTICTFKEAIQFLKNELFIEKEFFLCQTGDMTPVMNAAFFGRPAFAQIILDLSHNKKYRDGIYKMALQRDSGDATCLDLSLAEVDYVKYGCSPEDKKKVYQIFRELCLEAYDYAQKQSWTQLLQTFTRGMTKDAIFGKDGDKGKKTAKGRKAVESSDETTATESSAEESSNEESTEESSPKKKSSKDKPKQKKTEKSETESSESEEKPKKKAAESSASETESEEQSESSDAPPPKKAAAKESSGESSNEYSSSNAESS